MADIDVVPKKGISIWLWVIAAIVIAMILFAFMGGSSGDGANRVGELMNTSPADHVRSAPSLETAA
jgi:hypothetical protein